MEKIILAKENVEGFMSEFNKLFSGVDKAELMICKGKVQNDIFIPQDNDNIHTDTLLFYKDISVDSITDNYICIFIPCIGSGYIKLHLHFGTIVYIDNGVLYVYKENAEIIKLTLSDEKLYFPEIKPYDLELIKEIKEAIILKGISLKEYKEVVVGIPKAENILSQPDLTVHDLVGMCKVLNITIGIK